MVHALEAIILFNCVYSFVFRIRDASIQFHQVFVTPKISVGQINWEKKPVDPKKEIKNLQDSIRSELIQTALMLRIMS